MRTAFLLIDASFENTSQQRGALRLAHVYPQRQLRLSQSQAAINSNNLARHPFRSGTRKPHDPFRQVVRNAAPPERYARTLLFLDCRSLFRGEPHHARQRARFRRSCRHGVHAYAEWCKLQRPAACQLLQGRFAGGVMRQSSHRLVTESARDINDRAPCCT